MRQLLLFSDPKPLVERLGAEFFRNAPQTPGVYLMRDGAGEVVYVGKARNLRQRLSSYRVANPERGPRRRLRLLRVVASIELEECVDEAAALTRESALLRALCPRFNRAGTWQGRPHYTLWRIIGRNAVELRVGRGPEEGWRCETVSRTGSAWLRCPLGRLIWRASNPGRSAQELPAGWNKPVFEAPISIVFIGDGWRPISELEAALPAYMSGDPGPMSAWCEAWVRTPACPCDQALLQLDLEALGLKTDDSMSGA